MTDTKIRELEMPFVDVLRLITDNEDIFRLNVLMPSIHDQ